MLFDDNVDPNKFSCVDDVIQKLNRTVIMYRSEPYYVQGIAEYDKVSIRKRKNEKAFVVDVAEIDYQAPKLGLFYEPVTKQAILAKRWCNRQYQGGLPPQTVSFFLCNHNGWQSNRVEYRDPVFDVMVTACFSDMLNNKYHTVAEALTMLREGASSVPVRRFHWFCQNKSTVSFFFKDILLAQYGYKSKTWTETNTRVPYIQEQLSSFVAANIREFMNYVDSV